MSICYFALSKCQVTKQTYSVPVAEWKLDNEVPIFISNEMQHCMNSYTFLSPLVAKILIKFPILKWSVGFCSFLGLVANLENQTINPKRSGGKILKKQYF